ncbi:MAG: alpha/beta fold hydrolase [Gammaproteobacteria bacterium]|nr:alpha/beta fold hydrolase [Gammaproteobacteria bacterium]
MPQLVANNVQLEYDTFGVPDSRPLLMVMGLGAQLIHWRPGFCEQLAASGHYVVRFDNRDTGLSEKFGHLGVPNIMEMMLRSQQGEPVDAPYSLDDLAADALGLLDALEIEAAHICGASMGGMVVQAMAINAPERVKTLTSIMSSTGNPELPASRDEAMAAMLSPAAGNRDEAVERSFAVSRVIGSPGFPAPEEDIKARAAETFDRNFYPEGVTRQMAAIAAHGNRKPALAGLSVPALVIHGKDDPLVPVEGGVDTHEALTGSELHLIEGMGHDLPELLWPEIVARIAALTERHH